MMSHNESYEQNVCLSLKTRDLWFFYMIFPLKIFSLFPIQWTIKSPLFPVQHCWLRNLTTSRTFSADIQRGRSLYETGMVAIGLRGWIQQRTHELSRRADNEHIYLRGGAP